MCPWSENGETSLRSDGQTSTVEIYPQNQTVNVLLGAIAESLN